MMERRFLSPGSGVEYRKDGGGIEGYAAVYYDGTPKTEFRTDFLGETMVERIAPGAFDQTIKADDIYGLFNHDRNQVLGRSSSGTLKLSTDRKGFRYRIEPSSAQLFLDVREMVIRRDVDGSSFSFKLFDEADEDIRHEEEDGKKVMVRTLRRVTVGDVGPVAGPAYTGTTAEARAVLDEDRLRAWVDRVAEVRRRNLAQLRRAQISLDGLRG